MLISNFCRGYLVACASVIHVMNRSRDPVTPSSPVFIPSHAYVKFTVLTLHARVKVRLKPKKKKLQRAAWFINGVSLPSLRYGNVLTSSSHRKAL